MNVLGLNPVCHAWATNSHAGYNVVGTQTGTTASNEFVLITAHLDDMPSSGRAPGADDNASGSAAVLAATSVLSQYRFDRSIRYLLFTGEEQGLLGSAAYAAATKTTGDDIRGVLNLDMISWDGSGDPTLLIYTHSVGHAGYSNDLEIAATFTNVVAAYGLRLQPEIRPGDWMVYSDHASFWSQGYPAILAIEYFDLYDDPNDDRNPYYHTANDTLAAMNIPYFTAFAQASVGTVAHLARVAETRAFDAVRVISGDWTATNRSFGATLFHARHEAGAVEETDASDVTWASAPPNTNAGWLKIASRPGADELVQDSRGADSDTIFRGFLSFGSKDGMPLSCTNMLRFLFLTPPDSNRLYAIRVAVDPSFTTDTNEFLCVTNGSDLARAGGFIQLPPLTGLTNGAVYGTCDIGARFFDPSPTQIVLRITVSACTQMTLRATAQLGARVVDEVEVSTNLLAEDSWSSVAWFTNSVVLDADHFDSGWGEILFPADLFSVTNPGPAFFRIRRQWLSP